MFSFITNYFTGQKLNKNIVQPYIYNIIIFFYLNKINIININNNIKINNLLKMSATQVVSEDCGDLEIDFKYEILPDDFLQYDLSFKIIVIGDSGVGKSCLTNRATTNLFEDTYSATVGFEFLSFNVKIEDKVIKLQIWDTCGQELYRSLITNFYRNSSLAIIVYAVNSKDSFENIEMWLRELRTHSNPDAKVFLIGNKIDLENERKITKEQGESFAKSNKLNLFIESSAKTGFNSKKIFIKAAKLLYDEHLKYKEAGGTPTSEVEEKNFEIMNKPIAKKEKKGCC